MQMQYGCHINQALSNSLLVYVRMAVHHVFATKVHSTTESLGKEGRIRGLVLIILAICKCSDKHIHVYSHTRAATARACKESS